MFKKTKDDVSQPRLRIEMLLKKMFPSLYVVSKF